MSEFFRSLGIVLGLLLLIGVTLVGIYMIYILSIGIVIIGAIYVVYKINVARKSQA